MKVEGDLVKRFAIYRCNDKGEIVPGGAVAEYDTIDEVRNHRYRRDWHYKIRMRGSGFLTQAEFANWAKQQKS